MENNTPNNLLPFSWEEAQRRPDAVVTRDGRPVKLAGYNPKAVTQSRVLGWLDVCDMKWSDKGRFSAAAELPQDLFLKPEAREMFHNIYPIEAPQSVGCQSVSLDGAITLGAPNALAVLRITYEGNRVADVAIVHRYNVP